MKEAFKGRRMSFLIAAAVILTAASLALCAGACTGGEVDDTDSDGTYYLVFEGEDVNIEPINISSGGAIKLPTPERVGYTFGGWYADKDFNVKLEDYLAQNVISANVTAYAKWEATRYTLSVGVNNPNAGKFVVGEDATEYSEYETQFVAGESFELTKVDLKSEAYAFIGWYVYDGETWSRIDSADTYAFTAAAQSVSLQARWQGERREAVFYRNYSASDFEIIETKSFYYGDSFTVVPDLRSDYLFTGWYSDPECTELVAGADGEFVNYEPGERVSNLYAGWKSGNTALIFDSATGDLTGYDADTAGGVIHIPSEFAGNTVSRIRRGAFAGYEGFVVVPSSVTAIDDGAFAEGATVLFDVDFGVAKATQLAGKVSADGAEARLHLFIALAADSEYLSYVEAEGEIYDTLVDSAEEFLAVAGYCWLYDIGSEYTEQTFVTFDFSRSGIPESELRDTVFGEEGDIDSGWLRYSFSRLGLKSDTSYFSYGIDGYTVRIAFNSRETHTVASDYTSGENLQGQAEALLSAVGNHDVLRNFAIDSLPEYTVYNSEQLVYAVENGYSPRFGTLSADADAAAVRALESAMSVYETARAALCKITTAESGDYEKLLAIHDYIAEITVYDHELLNLSTSSNTGNTVLSGYRGFGLEGVFIDRRAVCDGISKAFMLMARIEGIETIRVSGKLINGDTVLGHAWNKVRLGNTWYVIDVTGDDLQVSMETAGVTETVEMPTHMYFLVSDEYASKNGYIEDGYGYPAAYGNYYHYREATLDALGDSFKGKSAIFRSSDTLIAALNAAERLAREIFAGDRSVDTAIFEFYWDLSVMPNVTMRYVEVDVENNRGIYLAFFTRG